jgi:hypothetical protein
VFIGSIKHQVIKHKQTAPYVLLSANLDQLGRCIAFEDMKDLRTAGSFGSVQATTGEEEKRDGEDTCQQDHGQEGENQFRLEKHFHQCSPSGMFVGYSPTTPGEKTPTTKPKYEMGLLDDELITVRSNSFPNAFQKPKATRGCAERSLGTGRKTTLCLYRSPSKSVYQSVLFIQDISEQYFCIFKFSDRKFKDLP